MMTARLQRSVTIRPWLCALGRAEGLKDRGAAFDHQDVGSGRYSGIGQRLQHRNDHFVLCHAGLHLSGPGPEPQVHVDRR